MADVILTRQAVPVTGLDPTDVSIDATDVYFAKNARGMLLHFKNTGGSPSTVTFDLDRVIAGVTLSDQTVNVPATTGDVFVAAFPAEWEDLGTNPGHIKFTQDQATGVTVAVVAV